MNNSRVIENLNYLNERFKDTQAFSDSTAAGEYLNWLADQIRENDENPLYRDTYKPVIEGCRENKKKVFASVIMRTQGKRPEGLREALLCLYAQSDRDFEVILIGHKLNKAQLAVIQGILEELDPEFREQIRFEQLDYGTRTTPINYGFSLAYGEYIMIFDDDDLLLEDWIHNFHEAAKKAPGSLLHTYAYGQKWKDFGDDGEERLCAIAAPDAKFCAKFDLLRQLEQNLCPLMTIAFPKAMFHEFGFMYDETLTTTEDWDYIMRMAFICGVTDIEEAGAIYRLWENVENSAVLHTQEEWKKNYNVIRKKHKGIPVVLRKGLIQEMEANGGASAERNTPRKMDDKLYYGQDSHWSEERAMTMEKQCLIGSFEMTYTELAGKHTYKKLRWDPVSYGNIFIRNLGASITDTNGQKYYFKAKDIHSTGDVYHNGILFLKDDPQVYFDIPEGFEIKEFSVWGESSLRMTIWENHKAMRLFVFIKKILQKLHIV